MVCEELYVYYGVGPLEAGTTIHKEFILESKQTPCLPLGGF